MKEEQQYSERLRRLMGLKPTKPVNLQHKKLIVTRQEKLMDNPFTDDEMNIINVDMNRYIKECNKIKDQYKSVYAINAELEAVRINKYNK